MVYVIGMKTLTITKFFKLFPNDDSCLEHLFKVRFGHDHNCPKCNRKSKWFKIKAKRAYSC